jgi:hypothetical protein
VVASIFIVESSSSTEQPSNKPAFPLDRREAFEIAAAEHKSALAEYAADTERTFEAVRAGNASGREALRAITLINGGAAVAMLAFIGHLASTSANPTIIINFAKPLRLFVIGTLLSVVASGVTYLAQRAWFAALKCEFESKEAKRDDDQILAANKTRVSKRWVRVGECTNLIVISLGAAALFCFAYGCYIAYRVFESGILPYPAANNAFLF